ncbi:MAG: type 1 glutamine amidotransferase [Chloroflexi bacterium]|nr:MAG: type 1 glutamine amidotransferase [Chloroflexota bacterium]
MEQPLKGTRIAVLIENTYQDLEFWYPTLRLRAAGAEVQVVGESAGKAYTGSHGYPAQAEVGAKDVRAEDFDGVVIPGGYAPDKMRRNPAMVDLVKSLDRDGKLVAAICHAGWMLAEADIVRGRRTTSVANIRTDLIHAGANWEDAEVVVDRNLVTSREPKDLPAFGEAIIDSLVAQKKAGRREPALSTRR